MEYRMIIVVMLAMMTLNGCIPELLAIRTVDKIQESKYYAERVSSKAPAVVTSCMMGTLYGHTDSKGTRPYSAVTTQAFGSTHAITLRTPQNLATKMYGGGDELLFLIDNATQAVQGTKSRVWVNQGLFSAQTYLDTLVGVVEVCL